MNNNDTASADKICDVDPLDAPSLCDQGDLNQTPALSQPIYDDEMRSHSSSEAPTFESPPPSPSQAKLAEQSPSQLINEEHSGSGLGKSTGFQFTAVEVRDSADNDSVEGGPHPQTSAAVVIESAASEVNGDLSGPDDDASLPISNKAAASPPQVSLKLLYPQPNSNGFSPIEYLSSFNILRLSFHKCARHTFSSFFLSTHAATGMNCVAASTTTL